MTCKNKTNTKKKQKKKLMGKLKNEPKRYEKENKIPSGAIKIYKRVNTSSEDKKINDVIMNSACFKMTL